MPAQSHANRSPAIRIGVVLSGTVVAEHIVSDERAFSIGQSSKATIQLAISSLPRHWELLTRTGDRLRLRLAPGMDVRLAVDDAVWTRAECDARGTRSGDVTVVELPATTHGRIDLGEVRVLFQGMRLPAATPVPTLPRGLQGTLADRIDPRIAAFAAASLVAHIGLMVAAYANDPPGDASMAERATEEYRDETVAVIDASDLMFATDPEPTPTPAPGTQTTPAKPEPTTRPTRPTTKPGGGTPAAQAPTLTDPTADATRMADLLFASDGQHGRLVGDLSPKKPGTDLAQQLSEVKDANQSASIGDQSGRVRPDGAPRLGTVGDPIPGTPTVITNNPKQGEQGPPGRIRPIPTPQPPGGPDVDSIIRKISTTYMSGLQRCYKKSLVLDNALSGKVNLSFTVTDRGALTDGKAQGVDDQLAGCIDGLMSKWTFVPVVDGDGDPTDVDVRLGLQLKPN